MQCLGNQCPRLQQDAFDEIQASNPDVSAATKAMVDTCDEIEGCAYNFITGMKAFTPKGLAEVALKSVQVQRGNA